jgi:Bacterial regulatory proteins, luxR family
VLRLVAAGAPNRAIARQLVVTPDTVKKHLTHVFDKLGVANRTQAVARARELGLLPLSRSKGPGSGASGPEDSTPQSTFG